MQRQFDGGDDLIVHVDTKNNVNNSDDQQQKCVSVSLSVSLSAFKCSFMYFLQPAATNECRVDILSKNAIDI